MFSYPVSLKFNITRAKALIESKRAEINIRTTKNGYTMESHPIKMNIDNEQFFDSIGIKSNRKQAEEIVQKGKQAVYEFMERKAEEKNALLGPHKMTIAEARSGRFIKNPQLFLEFIPDAKPEISWTEGYNDINYKKDDLDISWNPGSVNIEYVPYSVEISVDRWSDG
ncbi:hypothetical protein SDC9_130547 [bioreactor metagenome]|uniref:Uncharacterized protein n=1 Tax=bioreactor metagenome TaxID=1076179 RepID=A0A645D301_9ZZZZ|nr:DUF6470 family protein [Oscillospiraceae bacterium]